MSCRLSAVLMIILGLAAAAAATAAGAGCGQGAQKLRLRSTTNPTENEAQSDDLQELDLSQLSTQQLQQLMQQLQLQDDYVEDHRGSSRPWKKVQRIIRRQLVHVPKRYLKKLLRQFGLARSSSSYVRTLPEPQFQEYYLIPLE